MVVERISRRLDDLDGSELNIDQAPVTFSMEGVEYEIDLSPANVDSLRSLLAPFIEVARPISAEDPRPASRAAVSAERRAIRDWALANGFEVSSRGRISDEVLSAYEARQ